MDKLKEQLAVLRQHSFWIMCGGILIVSLVSWYLSTSSVAERHEAELKKIEGEFRKLTGLQAIQNHPNATTAQAMDALIAAYAREVDAGWQRQYDMQSQVLVWPASFDQQFHDAVNKYRPIEVLRPGAAITQELPLNLRQLYRNYIENDLPVLARTIGADWRASSMGVVNPTTTTAPALDANGNPIIDDKSVVLWAPENQQQLLLTHFGFITGDVPSTLQVLYAQEDLWVLQNIMDIIKVTNDGATARHEAVIKEIDFVRIGRSALGLAGSVTRLGPPAGAGLPTDGTQATAVALGAEAAPPPENQGMAMPPVGMPADGAGLDPAASITSDPASGRYVDEKYQPLNPDRLRNALTSQDENDALLAVAKRIPVRLRFKLDQRKLNVLLSACGNAPLPVEVRQVRVNPDRVANQPGASGGGQNPPPIPGAIAGGPGFGIDGGPLIGTRPAMVRGSIVSDASVDTNVIDVELYGVVYIYNPVNKKQLGEAPAAGMPTASVAPAAVSAGG